MPHPRKSEPIKNCQQCGVVMERKRYNGTLESMNAFLRRNYCNLICAGLAHQKADVSLAGLRKRSVKMRGDACQICGATTGLQVHHLDANPAHNAPSNLMTLCGSCHTRWHWAHGKTLPKRQSVCLHCDLPARRLDMCQKHYQRSVKYGSPFLTKTRHGRQWSLVDERLGPLVPATRNTTGKRRAPRKRASRIEPHD